MLLAVLVIALAIWMFHRRLEEVRVSAAASAAGCSVQGSEAATCMPT